MNSRKGFTLFELLISMAILSLVFSFGIPTFRYYQREAINARIDGDLRVLSAALKVYQRDQGSFPEEKDYQKTLINSGFQIIDKLLPDPYSDYGNIPYFYRLSLNKNFYLIYSVGLLGVNQAEIANDGKLSFKKGDPRVEKWISNGKI
jgi:prepilin-type N-terminal cleavage/methylation domain-containing protein